MAEARKNIRIIFPLAAYVGSMLGAGIYGLPYVMKQAGVALFIVYLVIVCLLVGLLYFLFADVAFRTARKERFLGYIGEYIGKRAEKIFLWINVIGGWGTGLSLMLVWGVFASELFAPIVSIDPLILSVAFFTATFPVIYIGSRSVERLDVIMLVFVAVLLVVLFGLGIGRVGPLNAQPVSSLGAFLPYGTLMFAFWGAGIIPEVVEQLRARPKKILIVLTSGLLAIACIYILFPLFVVSVSGDATTQEAIAGLGAKLGRGAIVLGSLIGMTTIWLSYTNTGWVSRNIMIIDFKMSRIWAMAITLVPSLALLLLGFHNFVIMMSIVGAVVVGLMGIMIFELYIKSHDRAKAPRASLIPRIPNGIIRLGSMLLIFGVVLEIALVVYDTFMRNG